MKKLFSSKSGFSLVEIIVAFAVFAVMAAMVSSIMSMALHQRNVNMQFADDIEEQKNQYAKIEKDLKYDSTAEGDTLTFNFVGLEPFSLVYSDKTVVVGASTGREGINYFVGNVDYNKKRIIAAPSNDEDDESYNLVDRLDSYIYGSPDFEYISVKRFSPATSEEISRLETDAGITFDSSKQTMYILEVNANDSAKALGLRDLIVWRSFYIRMPGDCNIADYGYKKSGGTDGYTFTKSLSWEEKEKNIHLTGSNYQIVKSSKSSVNISIPMTARNRYYAGKYNDKENEALYHFTTDNSCSDTYFLILDTTDTTMNEKSFGDNFETDKNGYIVYKAYKETKNGKEITHVNVYGGKPKSTPSTSEPDDEIGEG